MKKKRLLYFLIVMFLFFLIGAMIVGLYISEQISGANNNEYLWDEKQPMTSHVLVIVDDSSQSYDMSFEKGIMEAADQESIAVEIKRIGQTNYLEDLLDELDKAKYARMDGVIAHMVEHPSVISKVDELYEHGIPIVALNQDIPDSARITYVGVNRYDIGYLAGESLAKALDGKGNVVVISEQGYLFGTDATEDMLLLGLREVLKGYPDLIVFGVDYTRQGVLSAETVALDIVRSEASINGFFCTTGANTLGVVQMLIDNNMVNNLELVGYGHDPEIFEFIEKSNIVDASIVTDYEDIGRQSIMALVEYEKYGFVSSYINTDIQVIDESNLSDYLETVGDTDEE